jgi:hypothetical protein
MGIGVGFEGLSEAGAGFAVGDSAGHWCSTVGMKELVGDWAAPLPSRGRVSPGHVEQTNQSLSAASPMILVSDQHTDGCGTVSDPLSDLREHGKAGKVCEVDWSGALK